MQGPQGLASDGSRRPQQRLGMTGHAEVPASVERDALGALVEVKTAEAALEEGHSLDQATREVRDRRFAGADLAGIAPPVTPSAAIAAAERRAVSTDMARKVEAFRACALAWKGDMPLDLFLERRSSSSFSCGCAACRKITGRTADDRTGFAGSEIWLKPAIGSEKSRPGDHIIRVEPWQDADGRRLPSWQRRRAFQAGSAQHPNVFCCLPSSEIVLAGRGA